MLDGLVVPSRYFQQSLQVVMSAGAAMARVLAGGQTSTQLSVSGQVDFGQFMRLVAEPGQVDQKWWHAYGGR